MSAGFGGAGSDRTGKDAKITIDLDNVAKISRKYKRINKYMRSSYYDLLVMSGTEKIITNLTKEDEE